jgi:putative hemolysin
MVELGRACVDEAHRNLQVLGLLWQGIARYARDHGARYLVGCSSITSQDPAVGVTLHANLHRHHLAPVEWRTRPHPDYECAAESLLEEGPKVPKLLRAYLALGAWICGPPALDRAFKTIDFLTVLDFESLPARVLDRLLQPA